MSAFSKVAQTAAAQKPAHTCIVPLSVFSDTWKGRPKAPVCAGFRPLCLDDVRDVRARAAEESFKLHPLPPSGLYMPEGGRAMIDEIRSDAYADALMRLCVARSVCDPNDVTKPWMPLGAAADDNVGICLSVRGAQFLYRQIDFATVLAAPYDGASDEDLLELFDLLPLALSRMTDVRAAAMRKWLGFLLEQCRAFVPVDELLETSADVRTSDGS